MTRILFFLLLSFAATAQSLDWTAPDKAFIAGESVTLDMHVSGFDSIGAYQFTIIFDTTALQFAAVETDSSALGLQPDNFGLWNLDEGRIKTLWTNPYSSTLPDNSYIFTARFTALVDGSLSQFTGLEPVQTPPWLSLQPLAYTFWSQSIPLTFAFYDTAEQPSSASSPVSATPIQAIPNPCPLYTTIAFDATGETDFTCIVTDMQGRYIKTKSGVTSPGTNELPITLPASGMYIVAIKTKCATFVEKIVAQ